MLLLILFTILKQAFITKPKSASEAIFIYGSLNQIDVAVFS